MFDLDDYFLLSHLRMEGKYQICKKGDIVSKHDHVIFVLDEGMELGYNDVRKFGKMACLPKDEVYNLKPLSDLGLEYYDKSLTPTYLLESLRKKKVPAFVQIITLLFYMFYPVNGMYSITMWKDILFSGIMPLFIIQNIELIFNTDEFLAKKRNMVGYVLISIFTMILRHNGLYVVVLSLPFIFIVLRKHWKKLLIMFMSIRVIYEAYNVVVFKILKVEKGAVGEMLSVPMQQIVRTVKDNYEDIDEETIEKLNKYFMVENVWEDYNPILSDPVKFNFNNKDYLVYFIDENEENKQIFVSRLILNSEGKYFIDNIMPEEKAKLSEIVYNIVILIPTNNQKGEPADKLLSSLTEKYTLLLSNDIPTLGEQEYYNNCSIAITSKELVGLAEVFYNTNLKVEEPVLKTSEVPTWEIPSSNEVVQPVEQAVNTVPIFTSAENENTSSPEVKAEEPMVNETPVVEPIPPVVNNNSQATNVIPNTTEEMPANTLNNNLANNSINNNVNNVLPENNMPNPQAEKLAIVSDPSLASITGTVPIAGQPNIAKLNNKGKANVKYIIIGTICILLAIAVVVVAYILIQKKIL